MVRLSHDVEEHDMDQDEHNSQTIYTRITTQIIAAIAAGAPRCEMPWHRSGPALSRPANVASGQYYRGINVIALWVAAQERMFPSGYWATYSQWRALGAQVRNGEKGSSIVFYKKLPRKSGEGSEDDAESAPRLVARVSHVFNAAQVEGWEPSRSPPSNLVESIADAEIFIQGLGAEIRHGGELARYLPKLDRIEIPPRESFVPTTYSSATEGYYSTLFHELTHWSGHDTRLKRKFSQRFGNEAYAVEELVAELGAAFLCADFRISNAPRLDHAAYIASWLRVLGHDPRAIVTAASKASVAVEYLMGARDRNDAP